MVDGKEKGKKESLSEVKSGGVFESIRKNPWIASTVVLVIFLIVLLFVKGGSSGERISKDEAVGKLMAFISEQVAGQGEIELVSSEEESSMYKAVVSFQGKEIPVYVSLDGKYFITQAVPLDSTQNTVNNQQPTQVEIPKSDKPVVDLYVMSYCPYGTQMEKGILPVAALLGDKIDFKIKWVYYAMHGKVEVDENVLQYCVQSEQKDKYLSYLQCFLADSNATRCLKESKIDQAKLNKCINATDTEYDITKNLNDKNSYLSGQFPLFNIDKEDNERYNVAGSPTLIINGVDAQTSRSPAALLTAICGAFNNPPAECANNTLSSDSPSPGFGFNVQSGADSAAANCGF